LTRSVTLDTETTGLDFASDRIVEIGAVELFNDIPTGRTLHRYVNPGIPVPLAAQDVHGLTDTFLADKPAFGAIAAELLAFLADSPLIAHNAAFDVGMVNADLARAGLPPIANPIIDSLAMARRRWPQANNTLDALCKRCGLSTAARTKHGALLDAELLAAVYIELVGRQTTLVLETKDVSHFSEAPIDPRQCKLPNRLTAAEIEAHKAMISAIPNALWTPAKYSLVGPVSACINH
jgi:DNA polymerase-3 subunit epsilon